MNTAEMVFAASAASFLDLRPNIVLPIGVVGAAYGIKIKHGILIVVSFLAV